jgi:hypothetical protein
MIKFEASEAEINALIALIDAGVRASGIRGAGSAVLWVMKLETAVATAKENSNGQMATHRAAPPEGSRYEMGISTARSANGSPTS